MDYNTSRTTIVNSRSIIKSKIAVRDMKSSKKTGSNLATILVDVSKGREIEGPRRIKCKLSALHMVLTDPQIGSAS